MRAGIFDQRSLLPLDPRSGPKMIVQPSPASFLQKFPFSHGINFLSPLPPERRKSWSKKALIEATASSTGDVHALYSRRVRVRVSNGVCSLVVFSSFADPTSALQSESLSLLSSERGESCHESQVSAEVPYPPSSPASSRQSDCFGTASPISRTKGVHDSATLFCR